MSNIKKLVPMAKGENCIYLKQHPIQFWRSNGMFLQMSCNTSHSCCRFTGVLFFISVYVHTCSMMFMSGLRQISLDYPSGVLGVVIVLETFLHYTGVHVFGVRAHIVLCAFCVSDRYITSKTHSFQGLSNKP